jgi:hypothetical protein
MYKEQIIMNEFIRNAAELMTANYLKCEFFPRDGDKTLPDEKSIESKIPYLL